jgi:hypothetical protein
LLPGILFKLMVACLKQMDYLRLKGVSEHLNLILVSYIVQKVNHEKRKSTKLKVILLIKAFSLLQNTCFSFIIPFHQHIFLSKILTCQYFLKNFIQSLQAFYRLLWMELFHLDKRQFQKQPNKYFQVQKYMHSFSQKFMY